MVGLLLHLGFFAVAAAGVWVCGRALLEIDRRYAEQPAPPATATVAVRATTRVLTPDAASATAPAPTPPPGEPEPAALPGNLGPLVA
jgi:hypothetical protein